VLEENDPAEAATALAEAGIQWIQLRAKKLSGAALYRTLEAVVRRLEGSECTLWLDDRTDVAALFSASAVTGVHLGQRDLPPAAARRVLGSDGRRLGQSTHNLRQVEAAVADEAVDVVAVGPVFSTRSKANPEPVVGLELVRQARRLTGSHRPLVAIGGIDHRNLASVVEAGADMVAVLGAVCRGDVAANARRLVQTARAARAAA
jgi:thiamine-phosphate pyrophosphorylase